MNLSVQFGSLQKGGSSSSRAPAADSSASSKADSVSAKLLSTSSMHQIEIIQGAAATSEGHCSSTVGGDDKHASAKAPQPASEAGSKRAPGIPSPAPQPKNALQQAEIAIQKARQKREEQILKKTKRKLKLAWAMHKARKNVFTEIRNNSASFDGADLADGDALAAGDDAIPIAENKQAAAPRTGTGGSANGNDGVLAPGAVLIRREEAVDEKDSKSNSRNAADGGHFQNNRDRGVAFDDYIGDAPPKIPKTTKIMKDAARKMEEILNRPASAGPGTSSTTVVAGPASTSVSRLSVGGNRTPSKSSTSGTAASARAAARITKVTAPFAVTRSSTRAGSGSTSHSFGTRNYKPDVDVVATSLPAVAGATGGGAATSTSVTATGTTTSSCSASKSNSNNGISGSRNRTRSKTPTRTATTGLDRGGGTTSATRASRKEEVDHLSGKMTTSTATTTTPAAPSGGASASTPPELHSSPQEPRMSPTGSQRPDPAPKPLLSPEGSVAGGEVAEFAQQDLSVPSLAIPDLSPAACSVSSTSGGKSRRGSPEKAARTASTSPEKAVATSAAPSTSGTNTNTTSKSAQRTSTSKSTSGTGSLSPHKGSSASRRASAIESAKQHFESVLSPKMQKSLSPSRGSPSKRITSLWQKNVGKICSSMRDWRKRNHYDTVGGGVFIVIGGYPDFRQAMLNRGWIENTDPSSRFFDLIFTLKAHDIEYDRLESHQIVNHYQRNREITTKLGLTLNLRNSSWLPPVSNSVFTSAMAKKKKAEMLLDGLGSGSDGGRSGEETAQHTSAGSVLGGELRGTSSSASSGCTTSGESTDVGGPPSSSASSSSNSKSCGSSSGTSNAPSATQPVYHGVRTGNSAACSSSARTFGAASSASDRSSGATIVPPKTTTTANMFMTINSLSKAARAQSEVPQWTLTNSILQSDDAVKMPDIRDHAPTAAGEDGAKSDSTEYLAEDCGAFYPLCFDLSREKGDFCTAFQISKCQSILCSFLEAYDKCSLVERKDSFNRKKEPWELLEGNCLQKKKPRDETENEKKAIQAAMNWKRKAKGSKGKNNKAGGANGETNGIKENKSAENNKVDDSDQLQPGGARRRSSSGSSASSLFDTLNLSASKDPAILERQKLIPPFYTHSEDVVRLALKVCKRILLETDDTIDDHTTAECKSSLVFDEWKYLQRVNLDDPLTVLDRIQRPKDKRNKDNALAYFDPLDIKTKELKRQEKLRKARDQRDAADDICYYARMPDFASRPLGKFLAYEANLVLHEFAERDQSRCLIGAKNTWIIKPAGKSRGRGIEMCRELEEILQKTSSGPMPSYLYTRTPDDEENLSNVGKYIESWIVQKYIERPLTIKGYKFDIRQWVLVTDWNPLTVYMWKQPYLRFASNKYSTDDHSAYVHLVNNSIVAYDKDNFNKYNEELDTSHYMWFYQKFQKWLHDEYCPHCKAAAAHGHAPAVPGFIHEPPYTCDTFGVRWEDVRFIQEECDEEDYDDENLQTNVPAAIPTAAEKDRLPPAPTTPTRAGGDALPGRGSGSASAAGGGGEKESSLTAPSPGGGTRHEQVVPLPKIIPDAAAGMPENNVHGQPSLELDVAPDGMMNGLQASAGANPSLAPPARSSGVAAAVGVRNSDLVNHAAAAGAPPVVPAATPTVAEPIAAAHDPSAAPISQEGIAPQPDSSETSDDDSPGYQASRRRRAPPPDPRYCTDVWSSKVMPEILHIVKLSLLSVQDGIEHRKNSMELFGYDFMLDEDLKTWLIEVNSSPAMDYSTPVTTPLVKKVMEDLAKVVVDKDAESTGEWELVYQGSCALRKPTFLGKLDVQGKAIPIIPTGGGAGGGNKRK